MTEDSVNMAAQERRVPFCRVIVSVLSGPTKEFRVSVKFSICSRVAVSMGNIKYRLLVAVGIVVLVADVVPPASQRVATEVQDTVVMQEPSQIFVVVQEEAVVVLQEEL